MPYKDPATRRERRRDYMRDFMRRKRAAESGVSSAPDVSSTEAVSSAPDVSSQFVNPVSSRPLPGITPVLKARAAKLWALTTSPTETHGSKQEARKRFAEMAERAGVSPTELLTAIGALSSAPIGEP